ncbi:hypothetical protein [Microtetraspora malaysiensis]|uniref:hypothetical protein n=1 Tax=Microtetraspora malaysiensis TaxID=161358 RepID=UPI003D8A4AA4
MTAESIFPKTPRIAASASQPRLQVVLAADAALCFILGLAYLLLSSILADAFGVPQGLLIGLGVLFLPVGAGVVAVARRKPITRGLSLAVAAINFAWAATSIVYLLAAASLTTLGMIWVIMQAVAVAVVAELEIIFGRTG